MPLFIYKAQLKDGTPKSGTVDATDRHQAIHKIQAMGLSPIRLTNKQDAQALPSLSRRSAIFSFFKTAISNSNESPPQLQASVRCNSRREQVGLSLLNRLMELHASGLPVGDAINILSQRLSNSEQKKLAHALWRDLSEGLTLAAALSRQAQYFPPLITYVIEAGEATGSLSAILHKVINYLEEKQAVRQKVITSMAYPAFICGVAFIVVSIFLLVLLPEIESMLNKLNGELTLSAKLLISGADYLIQFGPPLLICASIAAIALRQWRRDSVSGRQRSDQSILKIPLIGKIYRDSDLFQSASLMSTLLASGINTTETLRLTDRTISNLELRQRFNRARTQVNEGLSIAQAFKRNTFFPELAIDILSVGENTGNLAHSMEEISKGFRSQLTQRLIRLTNIVATSALLFAFILVALIAIGIVTSVFEVSKSLSL
jgi:type II secretory pathway component PulF